MPLTGFDDHKLLLFDLDGTLVEKFTANPLPGVVNFFSQLKETRNPTPRLAICTNQGGVGLRYWMEKEGFGEPEKYPTAYDFHNRMSSVMAVLGLETCVPYYFSYRYLTKSGKWGPACRESSSWSRLYRKPNPGMLIHAMIHHDALPSETLMVGDSDDDRQAAMLARCEFMRAQDFFSAWG